MDLVKVVVLGASGVGKTSIIRQFVWNEFSDEHLPTVRKQTYIPSIIVGDRLYDVKISDVPVIPYFPQDSFCEWCDFRFCGLRSASAYILVFDLTNPEVTFQYIRKLRNQMMESRDMRNIPVLVVGNKHDILVTSSGTNSMGVGFSITGSGGISESTAIVPLAGTEFREKRRDIINLVKKHWKCSYMECSARFNWKVVAIFKELMKSIYCLDVGQVSTPMIDNFHEALDTNKCSVS